MLIWLRYLDRVIRGDATQPSALRKGDIEQPVGGLSVIGALLGVIYGLCMGCFALFQGGDSPILQLIATMLKVPVLFFLTLAVTFPSLYVFNALVGSRLSMLSVLRLLVISLTVMLTVLASLGPIVAFFSASTTNYHFMLLLNVAIFMLSGFLGLRYLLITLQRLSDAMSQSIITVPPAPASIPVELDELTVPTPPPAPAKPTGALEPLAGQQIAQNVRTVFRVWLVVFGLVGAQMGWVLRPFLGTPERAFAWFRPRESNFFEAILYTLQHLFR
jgi:hypothetical protein